MNHEPDPRFVEHLEWQLRSAGRRQGRFARPIPSVPVRALRTAALVVFCLMGGASAVMAADHLQDQEHKQHLVDRLGIEVEVASLRLQHLHENVERVQNLYEAGRVATGELERVRGELYAAETGVALLRIDLEEVQVTGREPRHDLAAPLVGGLDLVSRRLDHERDLLRHRLVRTAAELERLDALAAAGMVSQGEMTGSRQEIQMVEGELQLLEERISLRIRYVAGELVPSEVDLLERLAAARHTVAVQRLVLEALAERVAYSRKLEDAGMGSGQVRELELELQLAEGELRLRELELALLEGRR